MVQPVGCDDAGGFLRSLSDFDPLSSSHMDSSSCGHPTFPHRPRKSRQLVVPADTLLNFAHYNPQYEAERRRTRERNRISAHRRPEQFAQANYRFAVDPHYDSGYSDCVAFPDATIPWAAVDVVFMHDSHDCPICLHPLRCPRVTPCGHVFDFVCMLQHFSHSQDGNGFAKCPLCFSRLCIKDLRACVLLKVQQIEVGQPCTMRLLSRQRGHMLAHTHPTDCHHRIPKVISSDQPFFSRLAFADENYLLKLTTENMNELIRTSQEDDKTLPFVHTAMDVLKETMRTYRARQVAPQNHHGMVCKDHGFSATESKVQPMPGRDPWYFYQDKDSRNIFLHPVNHRCLITEVNGDLTRIEAEIWGTVLQIEKYTMTERLRRRYRVLEHLPIGSEFSFVELDLSHIISEKTRAVHMAELKERSKARRRQRISATREDRLAAKKRSVCFQEHCALHSGGHSVEMSEEAVDGRDPSNFPALCAIPTASAAVLPTSDNGDCEEGNEQNSSTASPSQSCEARGSNFSSYSSVTSNMGLFPSLEEATSTTSHPSVPDGSPARLEESADYDSLTNTSMSRELFRSALQSRGGRKNHGRTKVLWSNHGSACSRP